MADTITVKRRFAVWLEDAFEVARPTDADLEEHDGDVEAWALSNMDDLYAKAQDKADASVTLMWEDEHKADLDFPDDEIEVET